MTSPAFISTRLALHHAAQLAAAPAASLLPPRDDHSDRNLAWSPTLPGFVGRPAGGRAVGLRLEPPAWVLFRDGDVVDSVGVEGNTLADGIAWLEAGWSGVSIELPGYELPEHGIAQGEPAALDMESVREVIRGFRAAGEAVSRVAELHSGSEIRVWPHHFDLATSLHVSGSGEQSRSVGISFTPGDPNIAIPYLSVSPWPYPDAEALPALSRGDWHTDGFTAAVLRCPLGEPMPDLDAFLDEAVAACLGLLRD